MKKKILGAIITVLLIIITVIKFWQPEKDVSHYEKIVDEVNAIISDDTLKTSENIIEESKNGEDYASTDFIKGNEEELENDASVFEENLSYDGDFKVGEGKKLLGKYNNKLVYYNQGDKRWASVLYTSTNNKSQTIKSSGCCPTSVAMLLTATKGTCNPELIAKIFVDYGFRTKENGTSWNALQFTADFWDFKEYYSTSSFTKASKYLTQKNKYYGIASCGSGLWTTSGHYIFIIGIEDNKVKVYDPYYYKGKYDTASRKKAKATVKDNIVIVSIDNFKKYSNIKNYWIYSNDNFDVKKVETKTKSTVGKTKILKNKANLYSKKKLSGKKYIYKKNTRVKILKNINKSIDYVQVIVTGRKAYIKNKYLK